MAHRLRIRAALAAAGVGVALFAVAGPAAANGNGMSPSGGGTPTPPSNGGGNDPGISITYEPTPQPKSQTPKDDPPQNQYTPPAQQHTPPANLGPATPWTDDAPVGDAPSQAWVPSTPATPAPPTNNPQLGLSTGGYAAQLPQLPPPSVAASPPVSGGFLAGLGTFLSALPKWTIPTFVGAVVLGALLNYALKSDPKPATQGGASAGGQNLDNSQQLIDH